MEKEIQTAKIETFSELLRTASKEVGAEYFKLPFAGRDEVELQYRERVYCYELYHQMRSLWGQFRNPDGLTLSAEVDKRGHKHFIGTVLDSKIPDFLLHVAGHMGNNHTVVEVKTAKAKSEALSKDLIKLNDFLCMENAYQNAILLIFGRDEKTEEEVRKAYKEAAIVIEARSEAIKRHNKIDVIEIWLHEECRSSAQKCQ